MITTYTENTARRNVRLKMERTIRKANNLKAYLADGERKQAQAAAIAIDLPEVVTMRTPAELLDPDGYVGPGEGI